MTLTRKIIAVRGDTHPGNAGGLVNPDTLIPAIDLSDDGKFVVTGWDRPHLSPVQKRLWDWHSQDMENIRALAGKDEIIFLEMGDLTQGNKFTDDLAEALLSTQYFISKWNVSVWLDIPNVKKVRMVKGTGVHVWGEGATETMLAHYLRSEYPNKSIEISDHYMLDVDGYLIDMAHHGPGPGIRNWTRGNVLDLYARSILRDDLDAGSKPANAILRGHTHTFTWRPVGLQAGGKAHKLDAFITPPYCFIGSHARKVTQSTSRMSVGMLALELVDGRLLDFHPFTHTVDLRNREVL